VSTVGDVPQPRAVGPVGREVPLHEVEAPAGPLGSRVVVVTHLRPTHALARGPPRMKSATPLRPMLDFPGAASTAVHPGRSVRPPGLEVDGVDRHRQLGVRRCARADGADCHH